MKTTWKLTTIALAFAGWVLPAPAADHEASAVVRYHDDNTGLTIIQAKVALPTPGYWALSPDDSLNKPVMRESFVWPSQEASALLTGKRMSRRMELQEIDRDQWPLRHLGWAIQAFAAKHQGSTPKSLADFDSDQLNPETRNSLTTKYHLLDDLTIDPQLSLAKSKVLAFEISPLIDDGKHWVLLSNGNIDRRLIDPNLATARGVTIKARRAALPEPGEPLPALAEYSIHARVLDDKPVQYSLINSQSGKTTTVQLDPAKATPGERKVLGEWGLRRMLQLPLDNAGMASAILPHWYQQATDLYGIEPRMLMNSSLAARHARPWRNPETRSTGLFNVLGGRAAIRETLQMQDINDRNAPNTNATKTPPGQAPSVPIRDIKGVEVKSHPFESMLGAKPGGHIDLADVIPADHLFAYFPKPAGLISWLDGGAEFLFNAGSSATGRSLEYGLSERYLAALGMNRDWMKRLLDSGAIAEIAITLPDLFLIEGTELTVVARLKNPLVAAGLLQVLGIKDLDKSAVHTGANGEVSHWARRGDLLIVSSDAGELDKVLQLQAAGGKDSLGRSAELRYMLTKLPLQESTRAFIYLSDPFIRRLVSPATKIAQHRRICARSEMEALVAASLLHRLDGNNSATPAVLVAKHYLAPPLVATDAVLDPQSGAVSKTFGPLPRMNSLLDLNLTTATRQEADAYRQYLDNYNNFWRRYFDPIAIRIDQPDPATYELSVFILPLIDNSIYNSIREIVASDPAGPALHLPVIEPEPVATLSLNLREDVWAKTGGDVLGEFAKTIGLDTSILDFLGPDLHLVLADTDPILEMGSGELTSAFGSMFGGPMNNQEMMMIPAIVSMFTRPTAVCIGLSDPTGVRHALNNSVGHETNIGGFSSEVSGNLYKITGRDGWIYRISFFDMITLRLGIEVQDRFLVIRNMPLTAPFHITGIKTATQPDAQISVSPRACRLQLPALFASAAEHEREAAFGGISDLLPLLMTGANSIEEASSKHKDWFGFRPRHPAGGSWTWDRQHQQVSSTRYGSFYQISQPDYQKDNREFGPLRSVDAADVSMHFEADGLRTTARWKLRK